MFDSAASWWNAPNPWLSIGISYTGLDVLGVPRDSLQSFPEPFREGMAARARQLGDDGVNDPKNWDQSYGKGEIHIGMSVFSDSEEKRRRVLAIAREQYESISGVRVLAVQDFGAQPGDLNPLGFKDGIDQPAIEGSGADPLPGQGQPVKAGEFILGYPGEAGVALPMPQPDTLGRNGTYVGFRKYQSRVGAFNRFLWANGSTEADALADVMRDLFPGGQDGCHAASPSHIFRMHMSVVNAVLLSSKANVFVHPR